MADPDALKVKGKLKSINCLVHKIETERIRGESSLEAISKVQESINHESNTRNTQKLKELYEKSFKEASHEEELLRQALSEIYDIRSICNQRRFQKINFFQQKMGGNRGAIHKGALMKMLQVSAQTLPLWVGKLNGPKPPPLCGAIPADSSYIAKPGDMVAALVKTTDTIEDNWILAEVVSFNHATKKYEVDDIHEDHKPRHTLSKSRAISLPLMRTDPKTDPDALFPKRAVVLALFPQTTCFYEAIIKEQPATATDEYEVLFKDNFFATGYAPPHKVSQRYVIEFRDNKKKRDI